jgi:hypothetical protein
MTKCSTVRVGTLLIGFALYSGSVGADAAEGATRKAAIFVQNRVGAALNEKVPVLEDLLTSKITEKGLSIVSREDTINALKSYLTAGIAVDSANATKVEIATPAGGGESSITVGKAGASQVAATTGPTKLDQLLSDNTSALKLAQNLGADYLLVSSITSLGTEKKTFEDGALKTVNVIHTMRVSYKVLEGVQGGSLVGDTIRASKTIRYTQNSQTEDSDILNGLLDEATTQVADNAGRKIAENEARLFLPTKPGLVEIFVSCSMQDLVQLPLLSDIRVMDDGALVVTTNRLSVQILNANVEIDGINVGTAPSKFKVRPGLSKMRISRAGFRDYESTVNFSEGQKFENVALQMSDAGYARWKDNITFLLAIKTGEKMTDGLTNLMAGFAQTLRQSGYRIDNHIDINAVAKGKSLFDGVVVQPSIFQRPLSDVLK